MIPWYCTGIRDVDRNTENLGGPCDDGESAQHNRNGTCLQGAAAGRKLLEYVQSEKE